MKGMSQWLMKKRSKQRLQSSKRSQSDNKIDLEPSQHVFKRHRSPFSSQGNKVNLKVYHDFEGPFVATSTKQKIQDESVYNEPWDIRCQNLAKDEKCCACLSNQEFENGVVHCRQTANNMTRHFQQKYKNCSKPETKTTDNIRQCNIEHIQRGQGESDTGFDASGSSDESDYYEFLENIERRLKIGNPKSNPVIVPKWNSPFYQTGAGFHLTKQNAIKNGFNSRCVDEILYSSGSDHSSGFFDTDNSTQNSPSRKTPLTNSYEQSEDSEIFSFTLDKPEEKKTDLRTSARKCSKSVYQTGCNFKGNRLLGDLIQLNYEKQQLH